MTPSALLYDELCLLQSPIVYQAIVTFLDERAPAYFTQVGTSPTGKYHPNDEHGAGGLILHTRRVFWLADDLCRSYAIEGNDRDLVLAACLAHDVYCRGIQDEPAGHTVFDHEILLEVLNSDLQGKVGYEFLAIAAAHAGRWGSKPITSSLQQIVHLADLIASRPYVSVNCNQAASL